jgi:hypothetical protein
MQNVTLISIIFLHKTNVDFMMAQKYKRMMNKRCSRRNIPAYAGNERNEENGFAVPTGMHIPSRTGRHFINRMLQLTASDTSRDMEVSQGRHFPALYLKVSSRCGTWEDTDTYPVRKLKHTVNKVSSLAGLFGPYRGDPLIIHLCN